MKIYWLISVLLGQFLMAGELEVRAYRADAQHFKQWMEAWEGPVTSLLEGAVYEGIPMGEAPFESRFFSEGDGLRDFTGWAKGCGLLKGDEGKAVFSARRVEEMVKEGR
ncbi:MAG: hypothetical protein P1U90_16585 [Akkermansiaceae bacterium]|nr:hypothetical protein [Akkermansiaceae bacterium]